MRIAFAGNPNSGKTTIFNAVSGAHAKVGNWGGVTVAERAQPLRDSFGATDAVAVDLPGAYSMSPFSPEESITSEYVRRQAPDVIVNVVDATNLSRSLFFTSQLMELGIPMVIALNKSDVARREGIEVDAETLSKRLGAPVVHTVAVDQGDPGISDVVTRALAAKGTQQEAPYRHESDWDLDDTASVAKADQQRYAFVNSLVDQVEQRRTAQTGRFLTDRVDDLLTNPLVGIPVFGVVMWFVFSISQVHLGPVLAEWLVGGIEAFQEWTTERMADSPELLTTIVADGAIGGVGAVIGFLPLVMVMYFLIALLEESGYLARVSAVLDPIFKRVGLSGKSVIPIVIGTGCAIPAVMATRTIRDVRERRATAMLASWIPCGAKIPVIALFAGAFFDGAGWVSWVSYFLGLVLIFLGALLVKAVTGHRYRKSFFIMELPQYRVPSAWAATKSMVERAKAFIIKAGTIILVCNLVVQVMQAFDWQFQVVAEGAEDTSILASIASPIAVLFIPLGFGAWQLAAAAVTGFIAKENVVGTLAVVYGLTSFINTEDLELVGGANDVAAVMGLTSVSALAYLFFNLFTPPCFATIGAMNSELASKKWLLGAVGLQLGTGYTIAFLVNQIGTLVLEHHLAEGLVPGLIVVALMALAVVVVARQSHLRMAAAYALTTATPE